MRFAGSAIGARLAGFPGRRRTGTNTRSIYVNSDQLQRGHVNTESWTYPLHLTGAACPLVPNMQEPGRDYGAELRAVLREVSGLDVPEPVKPRIGFLP